MLSKYGSAVVIGLFAASGSASAELVGTWSIGEGDSTASIQFDFLDDQSFLFNVSWDGSITGRDVFDIMADDDSGDFGFDFEVISYSFGDFLVGVGIEDAYDYGEGSPPDYADSWHYWVAEGDLEWQAAAIGFSDRILEDGSRDAWVFGDYDAPATIPAPATLAVLLLTPLRRQRRRRL